MNPHIYHLPEAERLADRRRRRLFHKLACLLCPAVLVALAAWLCWAVPAVKQLLKD